MTIYANAAYRVGHMGYCQYKGQSAPRVAPGATTDPDCSGDTGTVAIGPCSVPGYDRSENMQPIESAGNMALDLENIPGRREESIRTTVQVANGAFFADTAKAIIRDRTTPQAAGLRKGLQLHSVYMGIGSQFNYQRMTHVGVDCLVNSVGFNIAEGRPLTANVEWWPIAICEEDADLTPAVPDAGVLNWGHLAVTNNGTDYHPILGGVRLQASNNLMRIGMRKELATGGVEEKISRTPYSIEPGMEKIMASLTLHDLLPQGMRREGKWTEVASVGLRVRAAHPDSGYVTTRRYVQIDIGDICLAREGLQEVAAGRPYSWSVDLTAIGASITAGVVT